eukprot:478463_1
MDRTNMFLCILLLYYISLELVHSSRAPLPWSWDTVPLWADFFIRTRDKLPIPEYRAQFAAEHYSVISIEKCLFSKRYGRGHTEKSFYAIAKSMRKYSNDNLKILFYWNSGKNFCDCYEISKTYCPSPTYDHSKQSVRDWWVNALVTVLKTGLDQGVMIDGVFIDGIIHVAKAKVLLQQTRNALNQIEQEYGIDLYIIGNRLLSSTRTHTVSHLDLLPYVDGMCIEHFGAFEEVKHTAKGSSINPDSLLIWYDVVPKIASGTYGANKALFFKGIIGPVVRGSDGKIPSWPSWYAKTPTTNKAIKDASVSLITFPLAVFLCGIAHKNVYFSYGWWYDINHGYIPCPDNPSSCCSPVDWYPEFTNDLGEPLTGPIMTEKYKCNRSFEHANVYVDLSDDKSALIEWIPPTPGPTANPSVSPSTSQPTSTANPSVSTPNSTEYLAFTNTMEAMQQTTEERGTYPGIIGAVIGLIVVLLILFVVYSYYTYCKQKTEVESSNGAYVSMDTCDKDDL